LPYLFWIIALLLPQMSFSTVFQRQPIDQQIKEADAIMVGHYLRSQSVRLEDGSIATQMIFKMNHELGIHADHFGTDEIIIHYPGGQIDQEVMQVEGVPKFYPGEKVALMIKATPDRFWGMNLGFGTFKIINYGKDHILVNTIFPDDNKVGQIKFDEFLNKIKKIKETQLKVVKSDIPDVPQNFITSADRQPASVGENGKKRSIASEEFQSDNIHRPQVSVLWLVIILAVMGGIYRLVKRKSLKKS
jgi:hypothetical protein